MCLDGTPRHVELLGNLCIVAALKQQLRNLFLPRTQPNRRLPHLQPHPQEIKNLTQQLHGCFPGNWNGTPFSLSAAEE